MRKRLSADVLAELRRAVADRSGAEVKVQNEEEGPPSGAAPVDGVAAA